MVEQRDVLNNHDNEQLQPSSCKLAIESLRVDLLKGNQVYLDKIELGRKINKIIEKGVVIEGGNGVATVTKEGLGLTVGGPAVNAVPVKNITEMVEEELKVLRAVSA